MMPPVRIGLLALALLFPAPFLPASAIDATLIDGHGELLENLFRHLDPAHPAVGPLREEWARGRRLEAAEALASYLTERSFPPGVLKPISFHGNLMERAEAALGDRFFLIDRWEQVPRMEGRLDWRFRGNRGDKEWAWMLNRHDFFPILAEAFKQTGDPRFRRKLNDLWTDWITANPYPDRLSFSAPWRALEVARRVLNSWIHVYFDDDVLDPGTRLLAFASMVHHGDALREHASFWGGNHLITEKLALLALATAWPELEPSAEWQAYAAASVSRQILSQTYPDGSYKELSNHYQRVVLVNAQLFLRLLAQNDPGLRTRPVYDRIEAMWDFFARSTRPDGTGPLNNAADLEQNSFFLERVWDFYDRPDWLYIATGGSEGFIDSTESPSVLYPWAGQAFLRSGWDEKAHWAYFDAGPYGTAHQHVDRFHVSASLNGRPLLVDTGRYIYRPGPWKDFFQGPDGHSILFLDGQPPLQGPRQVEKPLPVALAVGNGFSFAAARAHFSLPRRGLPPSSHAIPWTRALLLDHRGILLVLDHIVSFADHELQANWHFHPQVSRDEALACLRPVLPGPLGPPSLIKGREAPLVGGFYSPDYNQRLPASMVRFEGRLSRPTTLAWILREPGTPPLEFIVTSQPGAPVLRFRLLREGLEYALGAVRLHPQPALLSYEASP